MEKEKRKNIIIGFLVVIILFMSVIVGLLVTNKINLNNDYDNSEVTDNENQDVISDDVVGEWNLIDAGLGGEWYNKREIFGSCIDNGSSFKINSDNSYSLSIGCTVDEKGTYIKNDQNITFTRSDGQVYNATIVGEDDTIVIKYYYPLDEMDSLYLLFKLKNSLQDTNSNVYDESDFIRQTSITLVEEPECNGFDEKASLVATIENNGDISIVSNSGAAMISPGNVKYLYRVEKLACSIVSLYYITNDNNLYVLDNPRSDVDQIATKVTDKKVIEFLGTESKGNTSYLKVLLENNEVEYIEYLKKLS